MEGIIENLITNGFAVAISVYLLVRMEQKVEQLTITIVALDKSIGRIADRNQ